MRYDINLFIADKEVEFTSDPKVLFNFKETELHNPTILRNSFSKTIELHGTSQNNDVFGHIWNLDRYQYYGAMSEGANFNPIRKVPFKLFVGGDLYQRGYVKLDSVKKKNNTVIYSITLYGGLGEFFYNLSYDQNDTGDRKKTLADLKFTTANGETHPDLDFIINKQSVYDAWRQLTRQTGTIDGRWDVINFIPAYNGKPSDFSCDKVLINNYQLPEGVFRKADTVDGERYSAVLNGTPNDNGYSLGTASEELTEWESFDLRSYLQRPAVNMYRIIQACCDPVNNGGYQVKLDDHFFNYNNPYYYDAWVTLPMLKDIEQNKVETEQITGATLTLSGTSHYIINYSTSTLTSLNNVNLRMGVVFNPSGSTTATQLHTNRTYKSSNIITLQGGTYVKKYQYNCGVVLQLQALDDTGAVIGASKTYVLSGDRYYPDSNTPLDYWFSTDYNVNSDVQYLNGYWVKSGGTFTFCDVNGNPVDIDFSLKSATNVSRLVIKMATNYGRQTKYAFSGSAGYKLKDGDANERVWMYTTTTYSTTGRHTFEEAQTTDGVQGNFGLVMRSFEAEAYDYEGIYSNTKISADKLLGGEHTPADYLINYCKMFGLYFYQDSTEDADDVEKYPSGVIHIMDRDTFYTEEVVDLSKQIDYSRDMTITPAMATAKWYKFEMEKVDSEAESEYNNTYKKTYGSQTINTNYNFDNNTTNLFDGSIFKSGIQVWEKDKYFKMPTEGVPNYVFNGLKYELYKQNGEGLAGTEESQVIQTTEGWLNLNTYNYDYFDSFPKLQLHNTDNDPVDGDGVLMFFINGQSTRATYNITDDVYDMISLNGGEPCWLLTNSEFDASGNRIAYKTRMLPYFTRDTIRVGLNGNIINSWNFGQPQVTFSPDTYSTTDDGIYAKCWKNYINDLYDVNTKKLTCYANINLDGKPWPYWFRRYYWFDNSIWRLNEIKDLNMSSFDVTLLEFIKVQDINNYKLEQIRRSGTAGIIFDNPVVNYSAQTVTGKVIMQSGDAWAFRDSFYSEDALGNRTYYTVSDYVTPIRGEGSVTDFQMTIPENTGGTNLTWVIQAWDSDDNLITGSFVQEPFEVLPSLAISPVSMTISSAATSTAFTYSVIGDVQNIGVSVDMDWLTATTGGTVINVVASANTAESARTATITLTGTSSGQTIITTATLVQNGTVSYEFVWTRPANGHNSARSYYEEDWWELKAVNVNDIGATITSGSNWINNIILSGGSGVYGATHSVYVYFNENTGAERTGAIQVSGLTTGGEVVTLEGTITQDSGATPYEFIWTRPASGTRTNSSGVTSAWFELKATNVSNVFIGETSGMFTSFSVEAYEDPSSHTSGATHIVYLYFSQNTGATRTGTFTVTGTTGGQTVTLNGAVTQSGSSTQPALTLSPSTATVGSASGSTTYSYTIQGTVTGLSATTNVSWISQPISIDTTNQRITVYRQANAGASARTATITLSGNGGAVTATATLTQNMPSPDIIIENPTAKTITPNTTTVAFIYSVSGAVNNIAPVYTADWITLVTLDGHYLYIYCERNPEDTARTAQIRITGSTATGTVSATAILEQKGESLKLDPSTLTFNYNSGEIKTMSVYTENNWTVIDIEDEQ